jgi:small GTP-binding protein
MQPPTTPREPDRYKVILLGNVGVGKTAIANRQCGIAFRPGLRPSVGVVKMKSYLRVGSQELHIEIWDTAGQEAYRSLVPMYVRATNCCILVASITDPTSMKELDQWHEQLRAADDEIPIVAAVNKMDLADSDPNLMEQARQQLSVKYSDLVFVSALRGDGFEELFAAVGQKCVVTGKPRVQLRAEDWSVPPPAGERSSGCC